MKYVHQDTGQDLDPENEQRIAKRNNINNILDHIAKRNHTNNIGEGIDRTTAGVVVAIV